MQATSARQPEPPPRREQWLLPWLGRLWEAEKEIGRILWPMRFSVFLVLVMGPFLLLPQSQDALLTLAQSKHLVRQALFAVLVLLWALATHYWARFMSRLELRPALPARWEPPWLFDRRVEWLNLWIPRGLGGLAIVIVWIAMVRAAEHWLETSWPFALGLVVYGIAVIYRRPALARLGLAVADRRGIERDIPRTPIEPHPAFWFWRLSLVGALAITLGFFLASAFRPFSEVTAATIASTLSVIDTICTIGLLSQVQRLPVPTRCTVAVTLVLVCALFLASVNSAVVTGQWLASASIIMTVAAAWVSLGTFAIAFPGELLRLPIGTAIVFLALAFSAIGTQDNHGLRLMEPNPPAAEKMSSALQRWYGSGDQPAGEAAWLKTDRPIDSAVPLVIVATAGGASRAGFWTAKVLGELQDSHPDFHNYLFAISGVSGGSYGAAVYRALLSQGDVDAGQSLTIPRCKDDDGAKAGFAGCAGAVIKNDFLSPTFLTGLYADLTQRFLPGALLPDRATALERAWDTAWERAISDPRIRFSDGFHQFWRDRKRWLPALLLNGTSAKQGRRIITSNLAIEDPATISRFSDTLDFFGRIKHEISLSTAAHNSARFPYIDAAGTLWTENVKNDRIIDGGYFENFGAQTARELMQQLQDERTNSSDKPKIVFVVIQISSDPEMTLDNERNNAWKAEVGSFASDVTTPLAGFWDVREGHGVAAADALAGPTPALQDSDGTVERPYYAHFRLSDKATPMSWVLSRRAISRLSSEWESSQNKKEREKLDKIMCWGPPPNRCQPAP